MGRLVNAVLDMAERMAGCSNLILTASIKTCWNFQMRLTDCSISLNAQSQSWIHVIVVLIPCNQSHCHAEIDFRDGYEYRGVVLTDDLVDS